MVKIRKNSGMNEAGTSSKDPETGTLTVICRGCSRIPDCCSPECISCMCEAVFENGTSEKIRLVSSKDTELSGDSAAVICALAGLRRPMVQDPRGRRCSNCRRRASAVIDIAWRTFPDPNFKGAYAGLYTERDDGPECTACMQRTYNALSSAEKDAESVRKRYTDRMKLRRRSL